MPLFIRTDGNAEVAMGLAAASVLLPLHESSQPPTPSATATAAAAAGPEVNTSGAIVGGRLWTHRQSQCQNAETGTSHESVA